MKKERINEFFRLKKLLISFRTFLVKKALSKYEKKSFNENLYRRRTKTTFSLRIVDGKKKSSTSHFFLCKKIKKNIKNREENALFLRAHDLCPSACKS